MNEKSNNYRYLRFIAWIFLFSALGCSTADDDAVPASVDQPPVFIIGQDLDAIRGYFASDCCPTPDGLTAYVGLYNVLSEEGLYGGTGLDENGAPIETEYSWGAGNVSVYKTANEFGIPNLALGLFISENDTPGALDRLLAGEYDEHIQHLSGLFGYVEGTVYLRIGYEFDGNWNEGLQDTERFIEVWRYIVNMYREQGITNVEYVWQPSTTPFNQIRDEGKQDDIRDWYPGDDYVDWMGMSWFNNPDEQSTYEHGFELRTLRALADDVIAFARERRKPVMIAESTAQGFDFEAMTDRNVSWKFDGPTGEGERSVTADEIWDTWFGPLFAYMDENRDVVRGFAYINVDWDSQAMWGPPYQTDGGYWGDTRLEANEELAARFSAAIEAWRGSFE